jgi:hypothetical protein
VHHDLPSGGGVSLSASSLALHRGLSALPSSTAWIPTNNISDSKSQLGGTCCAISHALNTNDVECRKYERERMMASCDS